MTQQQEHRIEYAPTAIEGMVSPRCSCGWRSQQAFPEGSELLRDLANRHLDDVLSR